MTDERMALAELLQKSGDGDFLRSVAEAVLQILMETDVEGLIGAGRHERSAERLNYPNGYRDRTFETWLGALSLRIPKLRQGSYFLSRSTVDWDTSQADDFRTRGEPWTIKRTRLERGRARRSDRQGLARWRSGAAAGCRDSARVRQCCGCCAGKTWRPSRANWASRRRR